MKSATLKKPCVNQELRPPSWREVRGALQRRDFFLHYQPQVDASGGQLVGYEALARWQSRRCGRVSPDQFVPMIEDHGEADTLWECVLERIEQDAHQLLSSSMAPLHIALNLSASQLQNRQLGERFTDWLARAGLDGSQLHIELTESALLTNSQALRDNLQAFRNSGVAVWLDDFGTGYSSLRHLRDLPVSGLKIDKSFVDNIEKDLSDFRIVSAIVAMACSLGLRVVAEGVETTQQAQILTQLGCTTLQGYLIGRPATGQEQYHTWVQGSSQSAAISAYA